MDRDQGIVTTTIPEITRVERCEVSNYEGDIAWFNDSQHLAREVPDAMQVWDTTRGNLLSESPLYFCDLVSADAEIITELEDPGKYINRIYWSPNDDYLILDLASMDFSVIQLPTCSLGTTGYDNYINDILWHPNKPMIVYTSQGHLYTYDLRTNEKHSVTQLSIHDDIVGWVNNKEQVLISGFNLPTEDQTLINESSPNKIIDIWVVDLKNGISQSFQDMNGLL